MVSRTRYRHEDAEAALARSDAVVAGRFDTQWIHQAYLESQAATARPEPDGTLVVETATQGAFDVRRDLAKLFGLPADAVRVVPMPLGGSFGGKLGLVEPLAVGAALALQRPVRVAFTRSEDFVATNPAPGGFIELRIGARSSGELTGLEARIAFERGAVHEWGVEGVAAALIGGVYRWQAYDVRAYGVETNRVGFGAYRAPGAPPAALALETLLDELAERLGIDPLDLRMSNLAAEGDLRTDGEPWGILGTGECLERLRDHELWQRRKELPSGEGVGLAAGVWFGASDTAGATCRLDDDGGVTLVSAFSDMTGANTTFATLVAETLGIPVEKVRIVAADTSVAPRAPLSGGSKAIASVGRAVLLAAEDARGQLFELAAAELEADPDDLEISRRQRLPAWRSLPGGASSRLSAAASSPATARLSSAPGGPPTSHRPLPSPSTSSTCGSMARPGRSRCSAGPPRRTSVGRSIRRSARGSCRAASRRPSGGPSTRSSSPTRMGTS